MIRKHEWSYPLTNMAWEYGMTSSRHMICSTCGYSPATSDAVKYELSHPEDTETGCHRIYMKAAPEAGA